jgi:8-oxo-dGTP pyrophosphatase MutT (NUDIX family)
MSRPNDLHAVVIGEPQWLSDPPQFRAKTLDFASVCALRNENRKVRILSACAVIVCPDEEVVLLHVRGSDVATYADHLHTLGGAFIPPGSCVDADRTSLRSACVREVHEEVQLALSGDKFPPMVMSEELSTGFIQLVFLGFGVGLKSLTRLEGNWEGKPSRIPFAQLPAMLQTGPWTPSGKSHILAWLALGAPNAGKNPRFGKLSPSQLFDSIVGA